ncbi:cysteine-rich receptor-like protein kinase 19 [Silene latifolia]|uniref:cysteine-rich receptor-like protein kinase 19 n=1 Tax=Silene latifolia TaxID=37657 RepID=UPI003D784C1F
MMMNIQVVVLRLIPKSVLMLIFLSLIASFIQDSASLESPRYMRAACQETNSYISGSAFEANLNETLFTKLLPEASSVMFSNFTMGSGEDQVYALFYCKGDVNQQTCQDCIDDATRKIKDACKFTKEGIVWFEECTLRYANRTIFSIDEVKPSFPYYNTSGIVNEYRLDPYNKTFDSTMDALIQMAAYGKGTLPGFATKEVNLSSTEIIRGLAQCSPYIVGPGCYRCLTAAFRIWNTWANTMVFLPSCMFRYDLYETVESPPPAPSPPASTLKGSYIALIVVPSVAFIVLAGIGGFCFWRHRHYLPARVPLQTHGLPNYTYAQIREMTNFDKELGRGGFGVVYSGLLDGSREVAVKLLNHNTASKQLRNEIDVLARISHRNIVSLLGYCQDETRFALIYEYMAKGDLQSLLSGDPKSLSWTDRLKIAIDTAEGLDYLHCHANEVVVHRDVKPANILVAENLQAKLADFGSCKIFPKNVTSVVTEIVVSPGYTDPGYFQTGRLNTRADVYSFGIVLMGLITGKAPSFMFNLVKSFVKLSSQGAIEKILDPNMARDLNEGSVWGATELARECVQTDAKKRPDMSKIVADLKVCLSMEENRIAGNSDTGSTSMMPLDAILDVIHLCMNQELWILLLFWPVIMSAEDDHFCSIELNYDDACSWHFSQFNARIRVDVTNPSPDSVSRARGDLIGKP